MKNAAKAITAPLKTNSKLYVVCGAPGSGKSTFLKRMVGENEIIVSRDEIRYGTLHETDEYFAREGEVWVKFIHNITRAVQTGRNVYVDATHLTRLSRSKLLTALKKDGCNPAEINAIYFNVPLTVCYARNDLRIGTIAHVPRGQLHRMFRSFQPPIHEEGFTNIWSVDKDGKISRIV